MPRILLLEDDTEIRLGLEQHLRREGFSLLPVGTGRDALLALNASGPRLDAALLDLSLPDMDGLDVLRAIRTHPTLRAMPVLLVTARSEEIDRVLGLELGADDYISKPFSARELAARLRAILRRSSPFEAEERKPQLTYGPIALDLDMHTARVDGQLVELTRREFELLAYFLANPRRVLTREKILQREPHHRRPRAPRAGQAGRSGRRGHRDRGGRGVSARRPVRFLSSPPLWQ